MSNAVRFITERYRGAPRAPRPAAHSLEVRGFEGVDPDKAFYVLLDVFETIHPDRWAEEMTTSTISYGRHGLIYPPGALAELMEWCADHPGGARKAAQRLKTA